MAKSLFAFLLIAIVAWMFISCQEQHSTNENTPEQSGNDDAGVSPQIQARTFRGGYYGGYGGYRGYGGHGWGYGYGRPFYRPYYNPYYRPYHYGGYYGYGRPHFGFGYGYYG